jgi:hypothetical protein
MARQRLSAGRVVRAIKKPPGWGGVFSELLRALFACRAGVHEAREGWWSQAGSNRRPRECHSKDGQFLVFPRVFEAIKTSLVIGISGRNLLP